MTKLNITANDILSIMNATVNYEVHKKCRRELKKMGYRVIWDSYVGFILV